MFKKMLFTLITAVLIVGLLVGCGGGGEMEGGMPEDAALKVTGMVDGEVGWTEDEVRGMETMEAEYENKEGETESYTGVSLNMLLDQAGVQDGASMLELIADDGYSVEVDLAEVQDCADCIVAFRNQGGFSTVLPGFPKNTRVKGVIEISVK
jgi:hypothetical protein